MRGHKKSREFELTCGLVITMLLALRLCSALGDLLSKNFFKITLQDSVATSFLDLFNHVFDTVV